MAQFLFIPNIACDLSIKIDDVDPNTGVFGISNGNETAKSVS